MIRSQRAGVGRRVLDGRDGLGRRLPPPTRHRQSQRHRRRGAWRCRWEALRCPHQPSRRCPGPGRAAIISQIDLLLDISLQVTVELGRARMKIQEILALRNGSVIELDRLAGEPADILVNGTLIAKGEVVVVDEKFGVRVIEVVSRAKRIASLG